MSDRSDLVHMCLAEAGYPEATVEYLRECAYFVGGAPWWAIEKAATLAQVDDPVLRLSDDDSSVTDDLALKHWRIR